MTEPIQFSHTMRQWMDVLMHRSMRGWMQYVKASGLSMPQFGILMRLHRGGGVGGATVGGGGGGGGVRSRSTVAERGRVSARSGGTRTLLASTTIPACRTIETATASQGERTPGGNH